jgi:hypothetical protein
MPARIRALRLIAFVALALLTGAIGFESLGERPRDSASARATALAPAPGHSSRAAPARPLAANAPLVTIAMPPPGTPLVKEFDALKARADAGDAVAASQLYRDVQRCRTAGDQARTIAQVSRQLPDPNGEAGIVAFRPAGQTAVRMLSEMRVFVNANAGRCADATQAQLDALVPAMYRAAQLGDVRAIDCYAGGGFDLMPRLLDHPEWLADLRDIPQMFDDALRRGDWVAVELLHDAHAGLFRETPAGHVITADPALDYRDLRLERLGATGDFAQKLDRLLADAMSDLTTQQVADGDTWANDTYARYFAGTSSNEVSAGANICANPED